jgi:hypothetical protein
MNGTMKNAHASHGRAMTDSTRLWAGRGTGQPCEYCGKAIPAEEVQYDLELAERPVATTASTTTSDGRILSFHIGCYDPWRARAENGGC